MVSYRLRRKLRIACRRTAVFNSAWLLSAALLLWHPQAGAQTATRDAAAPVDHIGTWKCVVYGHPGMGDEQLLLRFTPGGRTEFARPSADAGRPWAPFSNWQIGGKRVLSFTDPRTGREFQADLGRSTLGGTWRTLSLLGGWWCSSVGSVAPDVRSSELPAVNPDALMPPLIPEIMATPLYPSAAIRRGLQGRAVACFFVDAEGMVFAPDFVELSDELFREPTLDALARSKYRRWTAGSESRPACRSYIFRLDPVSSTD
jgi:hypothetical protein